MVTAPDFTLGIVIYGLLTFGLFAFLWAYYDRRDRTLYDGPRRKITFHCVRCDKLYTANLGTETSACPKCAHTNVRLKF